YRPETWFYYPATYQAFPKIGHFRLSPSPIRRHTSNEYYVFCRDFARGYSPAHGRYNTCAVSMLCS
ncbi:MAG TPA: hypothetical protein VK404_04725, partial [Spirosoma sp.]|nr:hypothetical protein [Spirosoma sp.]